MFGLYIIKDVTRTTRVQRWPVLNDMLHEVIEKSSLKYEELNSALGEAILKVVEENCNNPLELAYMVCEEYLHHPYYESFKDIVIEDQSDNFNMLGYFLKGDLNLNYIDLTDFEFFEKIFSELGYTLDSVGTQSRWYYVVCKKSYYCREAFLEEVA